MRIAHRVALLVLSVIVAGCGTNVTPTPALTPVPTPVPTVAPTASPAATTVPSPAAMTVASPLATLGTCTEYTVKAGDTLSAIARANGTSTAAIIAANPEVPVDYLTRLLRVGQVICVTPRTGGVVPTPAPTAAATGTPSRSGPPLILDATQLIADIRSGAWLAKYPNVEAPVVWAAYEKALKADPALAKVIGFGTSTEWVGWSQAAVGKMVTLKICLGQELQPFPPVQYEDMQAACPWVIARMAWYLNRAENRADLPMAIDVIGWSAHLFGNQPQGPEWVASRLEGYNRYLDGACAASGIWKC